MDSIRDNEQTPLGSELFQDSESFLDELSYTWELDLEKAASVSIVISHGIGLPSLTTDFPTDSELTRNQTFFNEEILSFHFINS